MSLKNKLGFIRAASQDVVAGEAQIQPGLFCSKPKKMLFFQDPSIF